MAPERQAGLLAALECALAALGCAVGWWAFWAANAVLLLLGCAALALEARRG